MTHFVSVHWINREKSAVYSSKSVKHTKARKIKALSCHAKRHCRFCHHGITDCFMCFDTINCINKSYLFFFKIQTTFLSFAVNSRVSSSHQKSYIITDEGSLTLSDRSLNCCNW